MKIWFWLLNSFKCLVRCLAFWVSRFTAKNLFIMWGVLEVGKWPRNSVLLDGRCAGAASDPRLQLWFHSTLIRFVWIALGAPDTIKTAPELISFWIRLGWHKFLLVSSPTILGEIHNDATRETTVGESRTALVLRWNLPRDICNPWSIISFFHSRTFLLTFWIQLAFYV